MIYIVHGNDYAKSRVLIVNQQKKLNIDTRNEVDINEITPDQLRNLGNSGDLFGGFPFIVLDISNLGRKNADDYVEALKKIPEKTIVVVLSNRSLSKSNTFIKNSARINARTILNEKVPQGNVFKLLDSLYSQSRKSTYLQLNKLINEGQDPFYLMSMVAYGLRNIAGVKYGSPQLRKMNPYVRTKSENQARNFSEEGIRGLFHELYGLDKKTKTGEISPEIALTMAVEKVLNSL